jgi:hypothetical protein
VKETTDGTPLPLWRLISGFAVLGALLLAAAMIAPVYASSYRLSRYVKDLAAQSSSAGMPEEALKGAVVAEGTRLGLPVHTDDVTVVRSGGKVRLQVARIKAQVWHADLHLPAIATK